MKKTQRILPGILGIILLIPFSLQAADWSYTLEAYMFGTTIDGDTSLGRIDDAKWM